METAGAVVVGTLIQKRENIHPGTYVGTGKVFELEELIEQTGATGIVCDDELSPAQLKNLEEALKTKVMDRTLIILDIFAARASTSEGKIQVELAQLKYRLSRLSGLGRSLSRLGGGIGTRGPGEKKLEMDRRLINSRVAQLNRELKEVQRHREVNRQQRKRSGIPVVAVVGYTNAGKSTLLNALTGAAILAKDQLFATLDPTTRKCTLPGGETVLLTDTVGFIRNLPHHLVHAFRSTLEEATYADLLLILIDGSDPEAPAQLAVTEKLLQELGAGEKPTIHVYNKCDLGVSMPGIGRAGENNIYISAATGQGVDRLLLRIEELLHAGKRRVTFRIPNAKHGLVTKLYENATVENVEYGAEAVDVTAVVDAKTYGALREYDTAPLPETEDE